MRRPPEALAGSGSRPSSPRRDQDVDHEHAVLGTGDDQVEVALLGLLERRVDDVLAVEVADAFTRNDLGRYDVVVLSGSLPLYDERFEQALNDGGRLFAVVGQGQVMEALRITRSGPGRFLRESLFETSMDPLLHAAEPPKFVF